LVFAKKPQIQPQLKATFSPIKVLHERRMTLLHAHKCKKNKLFYIYNRGKLFDAIKTDKQQDSDKIPIKTYMEQE
jgi:hypothetical protein